MAPAPQSNLRSGLRDLLAGLGLIGLGLVLGRSILLGATEPLDWVFDALGLFWIGLGGLRLARYVWQK